MAAGRGGLPQTGELCPEDLGAPQAQQPHLWGHSTPRASRLPGDPRARAGGAPAPGGAGVPVPLSVRPHRHPAVPSLPAPPRPRFLSPFPRAPRRRGSGRALGTAAAAQFAPSHRWEPLAPSLAGVVGSGEAQGAPQSCTSTRTVQGTSVRCCTGTGRAGAWQLGDKLGGTPMSQPGLWSWSTSATRSLGLCCGSRAEAVPARPHRWALGFWGCPSGLEEHEGSPTCRANGHRGWDEPWAEHGAEAPQKKQDLGRRCQGRSGARRSQHLATCLSQLEAFFWDCARVAERGWVWLAAKPPPHLAQPPPGGLCGMEAPGPCSCGVPEGAGALHPCPHGVTEWGQIWASPVTPGDPVGGPEGAGGYRALAHPPLSPSAAGKARPRWRRCWSPACAACAWVSAEGRAAEGGVCLLPPPHTHTHRAAAVPNAPPPGC